MTLYEFINLHETDYDCPDNDYDISVTVCHIDEINDSYDEFCIKLIQHVSVLSTNYNDDPIVNWSEFIRKNMRTFREFTAKHWDEQYEDDEDDFIYQWIQELHMYLAGYVSEDFYNVLVKLMDVCEEV